MNHFLAALLALGSVHAQTKSGADLKNPSTLKAQAPATFDAKFTTTKGDFVIEVHRDWAPRGADRFYNLVHAGFFTDVAFFRVLRSPRPFMAQFGISPNPAIASAWQNANIPDDPNKQSNTRGKVTFATGGPNTRTTQVFINYGDNSFLDKDFSPFGEVIEGMEVVDQLYAEYGEGAPGGRGPDQGKVQAEGKAYLDRYFPKLDRILKASIVPTAAKKPEAKSDDKK
jgi:peptidyl-prolyl cis-trans isomerase A (cyclophilin A)